MNQFAKLFTLIILVAFASNTYAQNLILKGGLNLSTMTLKNDGGNFSDYLSMKPGYHLGATLELPLAESFVLETGLILNTAGYNGKKGTSVEGEDLSMLYLTIPILAKPKFSLNETTNVFIVVGPSVGFGLSGKFTQNNSGGEQEYNVTWGRSPLNTTKRFDYGLNFGAGVELGNLEIGLTYALGLRDIDPEDPDNTVVKNRNLMMTLGWRFGK